jgi:hypothetical protein
MIAPVANTGLIGPRTPTLEYAVTNGTWPGNAAIVAPPSLCRFRVMTRL